MKLATYKDNKSVRDGVLVVVSRDLTRAVLADSIVSTMQDAIDSWSSVETSLKQLYDALNQNELKHSFTFNQQQCLSPLPRAYQWIDGSAYVNHIELVRLARGAEMPQSLWHSPLMYQGGSDSFLAPHEPICMSSEEWGIDFEAEIAVMTDDVAMGCSREQASSHIKLLMLVNDVSLRNLIPAELEKGFGFFQSKPSSSFSPVAVTPDELGAAWEDTKVHLPLHSYLNNELVGQPNAGTDMTFNFAQLIEHATKSRPLQAGTLIGSGTVSNYDRTKGSSCLAEIRMLEKINSGTVKTPFLRFGDSVRIEMSDKYNKNIFGTIEQTVESYVEGV